MFSVIVALRLNLVTWRRKNVDDMAVKTIPTELILEAASKTDSGISYQVQSTITVGFLFPSFMDGMIIKRSCAAPGQKITLIDLTKYSPPFSINIGRWWFRGAEGKLFEVTFNFKCLPSYWQLCFVITRVFLSSRIQPGRIKGMGIGELKSWSYLQLDSTRLKFSLRVRWIALLRSIFFSGRCIFLSFSLSLLLSPLFLCVCLSLSFTRSLCWIRRMLLQNSPHS